VLEVMFCNNTTSHGLHCSSSPQLQQWSHLVPRPCWLACLVCHHNLFGWYSRGSSKKSYGMPSVKYDPQ
jgi:hypothetical protein